MGLNYQSNGARVPRQWMNLFEITNPSELSIEYRLLEVRGLPPGEHYDKNVNLLVKAVAYEIKEPVALVRRGGSHCLAIPADARLPGLEQQLTPHVAILVPSEARHTLDMARLDEDTMPIAMAFLRYALRTALMKDRGLWLVGRCCYGKEPLNARGAASVDIYPGFAWGVVSTAEGRFFLALDTIVRYIDRLWFPVRIDGQDPAAYRGRRLLYHFGHNWYMVQLLGLTGLSIAEQKFCPDGQNRLVDVLTWTLEKCCHIPVAWVRNLDPASPAILYRYPGNQKERYGALALCKLALSTADAEASGLHQQAILGPAERFEHITNAVANHFRQGRLGGRPIRISTTPLEVQRRVFPVPPQRFGHGRVLAVEPWAPAEATDVVSLDQLGRRRLQLLLDRQAGPLDTSPFDAQYIFMPQSLPRAINEDFEHRFVKAMREVSGQGGYKAQRVLYDDSLATSLNQQVEAIRRAIDGYGINRGYALLILPEGAKPGLHNYIKRELWPDLQFQCAMAGKIRAFYALLDQGGNIKPIPEKAGKVTSYVRNCALGMMVVNRKWLWALARPLHYDVHIGIDVLNRMAGLTFVYNHGQRVFFRNYPCKQKERLTGAELRTILARHLRQDLVALKLCPRSIVAQRDGQSYSSEPTGFNAAVGDLLREGLLPQDVEIGVVDLHKTTAKHLRLKEGDALEKARNPTIGSYYVLGPREGIVCTTGWPFLFSGTAQPLAVEVIQGGLNIEWVLEDLFSLSQLIFTAPDKCGRLPLTIKLADDFLQPIAGEADEEEALYGEEPSEPMEALDEEPIYLSGGGSG